MIPFLPCFLILSSVDSANPMRPRPGRNIPDALRIESAASHSVAACPEAITAQAW